MKKLLVVLTVLFMSSAFVMAYSLQDQSTQPAKQTPILKKAPAQKIKSEATSQVSKSAINVKDSASVVKEKELEHGKAAMEKHMKQKEESMKNMHSSMKKEMKMEHKKHEMMKETEKKETGKK
jgi:hypothetical protein